MFEAQLPFKTMGKMEKLLKKYKIAINKNNQTVQIEERKSGLVTVLQME